jgi:hypothetical protein
MRLPLRRISYLNNKRYYNSDIKINTPSSSASSQKVDEHLNSKNKKVPFFTFANKSKPNQIKDRLYVWGYSGVGALGKNSNNKKTRKKTTNFLLIM